MTVARDIDFYHEVWRTKQRVALIYWELDPKNPGKDPIVRREYQPLHEGVFYRSNDTSIGDIFEVTGVDGIRYYAIVSKFDPNPLDIWFRWRDTIQDAIWEQGNILGTLD